MSGESGPTRAKDDAVAVEASAAGWIPKLSNPSSVTMKTSFEDERQNHYGQTLRNSRQGLDIRVSRKSFRLALAVFDGLVKELAKRDISVVTDQDRERETFAVRGHSDRVALSVTEQFERVPHVPTAAEVRRQQAFSWDKPSKWEYVATGRVSLNPGGLCRFADAAEFQAFIRAAADAVVASLDVARDRRVKEQEDRHREYEKQARIDAERRRTEALFASSAKLQEYRHLLSYIDEVRRLGKLPKDQCVPGQTLDDWLRWAEAKAISIHPLR